jgi:hypothetical protein
MDHHHQETRVHSDPIEDVVETALRREHDRASRQRALHAEELRRLAWAVESNWPGGRQALDEFLPTGPDRAVRPGEPIAPERGAPTVGIPLVNDTVVPRDPPNPAATSRRAPARGTEHLIPEQPSGLLARWMAPPTPDVFTPRSIHDGNVPVHYSERLPIVPPASLFTGALGDNDPVSELTSQQPGAGVVNEHISNASTGAMDAIRGAGVDDGPLSFAAAKDQDPLNRQRSRLPAGLDFRNELATSRALAREPSKAERAIDSLWSGFSETPGPGDRRPSAINPRTMIETGRGSDRPGSPRADTRTRDAGKESMDAAADELERLRSAARRTADELAKIRGPVPPAFPARPPVFRDRS